MSRSESTARSALDMEALAQLRELFDGDLSDVIAAYLRDTPEQLALLATAIQQQDFTALQRSAHSLKSSSFYLGARTIGELAESLETLARSQGDPHVAAGLLAELRAALTPVAAQLRAIAESDGPPVARTA